MPGHFRYCHALMPVCWAGRSGARGLLAQPMAWTFPTKITRLNVRLTTLEQIDLFNRLSEKISQVFYAFADRRRGGAQLETGKVDLASDH